MNKLLLALTGALIVLSCGSVAAMADSNWCRSSEAPKINIKTSTDQVTYDFSKSEKQLNGFNVDTVNPYGDSVITDVGGLMHGGIMVSQKMRLGTLTNRNSGQICYWYSTIDLTLHINPKIYIASEFPRGTCKHNAIKEHELHHVLIDRQVVNKYAQIFGRELQNEVRRQQVFGPYNLSRTHEIENYLRSNMKSIISRYTDQMKKERQQRQQALDNLQEYERVNHACDKNR